MSIQRLGEQERVAATQLVMLSIDGLWRPRRVPLQALSLTVGRADTNDLVLPDPAVSRFHVRLARQGAGWRAEQLSDAKPMYVNGEHREMAWLGHGDQVVIGGTVLRLEQPGMRPKTMRLRIGDTRTALAFGLTPELLIGSPILLFRAPLRADVVTVGRAPECTLVIPSPLVSAHQALLWRKPEGGTCCAASVGSPIASRCAAVRCVAARCGQATSCCSARACTTSTSRSPI